MYKHRKRVDICMAYWQGINICGVTKYLNSDLDAKIILNSAKQSKILNTMLMQIANVLVHYIINYLQSQCFSKRLNLIKAHKGQLGLSHLLSFMTVKEID